MLTLEVHQVAANVTLGNVYYHLRYRAMNYVFGGKALTKFTLLLQLENFGGRLT